VFDPVLFVDPKEQIKLLRDCLLLGAEHRQGDEDDEQHSVETDAEHESGRIPKLCFLSRLHMRWWRFERLFFIAHCFLKALHRLAKVATEVFRLLGAEEQYNHAQHNNPVFPSKNTRGALLFKLGESSR